MTKEDRDKIDKLKQLAVLLTEQICQLELLIMAGQAVPYATVTNSSLTAKLVSINLDSLLMQHGARSK